MKKLLLKIAVLVSIVILVATFVSCGKSLEEKKRDERDKELSIVVKGGRFRYIHIETFQGHDYIVNSSGGVLHSESCGCKNIVVPNKILNIWDSIDLYYNGGYNEYLPEQFK